MSTTTNENPNRILIVKYEDRILEQTEQLRSGVISFQKLYEEFQAINIVQTLEGLKTVFRSYYSNHNSPNKMDILQDVVKNAYLDRADGANFNGIPISRNKIKELIELPSLNGLGDAMEDIITNCFRFKKQPLNLDLLMMVDAQVSQVENALEIIEDKNSHYTATEQGAEMLNILKGISDNFNTLKLKAPHSMATLQGFAPVQTDVNSRYIPSLHFLQQYEAPFLNKI